jgi:hypothetical protein
MDPKTWKGPWKCVTHPDGIAQLVKQVNKRQYHQAHNTPFGSGPLSQAMGQASDLPTAT